MKFRRVLFDKCVSQRKLAKVSGVSQPMISLIVRGLRKPGPEIRKRLARALRVRPEQLFEFQESK
jgi:transcriptional regulator with XRE-family HTH domain